MNRPFSLVTCLLVPFVILLTGLIFAAVYARSEFPKLTVENGRGAVPPGFELSLEKPAGYTVWLHTYSVFEGKAYEHGESVPPGARVIVIDKASGDKINLNTILKTSFTKKAGDETSIAVGRFEIYRPTEIEIIGSGFPDTAIVSVAESKVTASVRVMITLSTIVILTLFFALLFLIILLHRRQKMIAQEALAH